MEPLKIAFEGSATMDIGEMVPFQGALKTLTKANYEKLKKEIVETGFAFPIQIWQAAGQNFVLAGHQRLRVLKQMREEGYEVPPIPVNLIQARDIEQAKRRVLQDVSQYGQVEREGLHEFLVEAGITVDDLGASFDIPEVPLDMKAFREEFYDEKPSEEGGGASLADRFGVPPFSVLDARQGYWQERKSKWLSLGIESESGRGENLLNFSDAVQMQKRAIPGGGGTGKNSAYAFKTKDGYAAGEDAQKEGSGTSIFDPVLCELAYRWFCPRGGLVVDPFAGGSVRGIMASRLGLQYIGTELRQEQVEANRAQEHIALDPKPVWHCSDALEIPRLLSDVEADFVFSCPPYADLEEYSDDPRDLSNMAWPDFKRVYSEIIAGACSRLKNDRFACFVVGEVRDKKNGGPYRGFVPATIEAFEAAGLKFYNELILVTAVGTLALRTAKIFTASRKVGKTHQQVLVFCKGDPRAATEACGQVEVSGLDDIAPQD